MRSLCHWLSRSRLLQTFVVVLLVLSGAAQVTPRPCAGHGDGVRCELAEAAAAICSCCARQALAPPNLSAFVAADFFGGDLCGPDGVGGRLGCRPESTGRSDGLHISVPHFQLPGLWSSAAMPLLEIMPPEPPAGHPATPDVSTPDPLWRPPQA